MAKKKRTSRDGLADILAGYGEAAGRTHERLYPEGPKGSRDPGGPFTPVRKPLPKTPSTGGNRKVLPESPEAAAARKRLLEKEAAIAAQKGKGAGKGKPKPPWYKKWQWW